MENAPKKTEHRYKLVTTAGQRELLPGDFVPANTGIRYLLRGFIGPPTEGSSALVFVRKGDYDLTFEPHHIKAEVLRIA